jgi:hypothetical protein
VGTDYEVRLLVDALVEAELLLRDSLEALEVELELEEPNQLGLGVAHCQQLHAHSLVLPQVARSARLSGRRVLLREQANSDFLVCELYEMRLLVNLPALGRLVLEVVVLALDYKIDGVGDLDGHLVHCYLQEQLGRGRILNVLAFQG